MTTNEELERGEEDEDVICNRSTRDDFTPCMGL